jgi:hypothetical protein
VQHHPRPGAGPADPDDLAAQVLYTFTVTGVPAGYQFYGLRIGDQTRRVPSSEATAPVELTIGSVAAGATPAS